MAWMQNLSMTTMKRATTQIDLNKKCCYTWGSKYYVPVDVTVFTSQILPRSDLVLLESLLNISPAAQPTGERILATLHLGKVCPLIIDCPRSVL
jgi:hypothetical protein